MLYDKLKPHIKAKMKENAEEYESVNWLLDKLKNKDHYSDLTIEQIRSICTFGDVWYYDLTQKELIWGDWLIKLGAKDTSSPSQIKRGTTCFTLPTGDCISEHRTGYIRKNLLHKTGGIYTCYQLNPQYKTIEKSINWNGKEVEFERNNRMLIWNRAERLKRLVLYTIKQINKSNG
jgi:hypothetical protein